MNKFYRNLIRSGALAAALFCSATAFAEDAYLTIDVTDITVNSAEVTVTPSSDDLKFYTYIMLKSSFEDAGGADKAIENRIAIWERNASWYDNTTWQDMMNMELQSGVFTQSSYDFLGVNLSSDTDYVAYSFGMSPEGNPTTEVAVKEFKTEAPIPSDNTFELSVTSIKPAYADRMTVEAQCEPSNDDKYIVSYFTKGTLDYYDLTPGSDGVKKFVSEELLYYVSDSDVKSGPATYSWTLKQGYEYGIVAMGVDENLAQTTPLTIHYFTCEETEKPVEHSIELSVTDITPMNGHITITPSSDEFRYFFDVTTADLIEKKGGVDVIAKQFVLDWFDFIYSLYDGEVSYADIVESQTVSGKIDTMASELNEIGALSDILWGQDMVLYAVGVDLQGNVVTPTAVFDFSTPVPEQSDLEFEFEFVKATPHPTYASYFTATVNVYPSREGENYMVNYCTDRVLDQYDFSDKQDEMDYLSYSFMPSGQQFDQTMQFNFPDLYVKEVSGVLQNYYVVVMGWNEGPTTPLYKYMFNFDTSSVEKVLVNDVQVFGRDGAVYLLGEVDRAAIFSASGQLMGALNGPGSLEVPAGLYMVRYSADGKQATAKVVVK